MTQADIDTLKANIDKRVQIVTADGEKIIAKVISVFDKESDADMFYELISSSRPELYLRRGEVGGYSLPLKDIVGVTPHD